METGFRARPKPKLRYLCEPPIRVKQRAKGQLPEPPHQPAAENPPAEPRAHLPPDCTHRGRRGGGRKALGGSVGSPGRAALTPSRLRAGRAGGADAGSCPRENGGPPPTPSPPPRSAMKKENARNKWDVQPPAGRASWPGRPQSRRAQTRGPGGHPHPGLQPPRPACGLPSSRPRRRAARRGCRPPALTAALSVRAEFQLREAPARVRLRLAPHPPGGPEQEQPEEQPRRRSHVVVTSRSR